MLDRTDTTSFRRVRYVSVVIVLFTRLPTHFASIRRSVPRTVSFVPCVPWLKVRLISSTGAPIMLNDLIQVTCSYRRPKWGLGAGHVRLYSVPGLRLQLRVDAFSRGSVTTPRKLPSLHSCRPCRPIAQRYHYERSLVQHEVDGTASRNP